MGEILDRPAPQGAGLFFVNASYRRNRVRPHAFATFRIGAGQIERRRPAMKHKTATAAWGAVLITGLLAASGAAAGSELKSLTVCADPGNMPLSNEKGEGF